MSKKIFISVENKIFAEYAERLDKLGGDIKGVVDKILQDAHATVTSEVEAAMMKHNKSGDTSKSILRDSKVQWTGTTASIRVGFDISNGGLPSIFLMYGTPKHEPGHPGTDADKALYDAIYGKRQARNLREMSIKAMEEAIKKRMGG